MVRRNGGVIEHPRGSQLFKETGCGLPWGLADQHGGRLIEVDQFHWGHKARKRSLIYIVGTWELPPMPKRAGSPTHVIDRPGSAGKLPWVTKRERSATPPEFAAWLIATARLCKNP